MTRQVFQYLFLGCFIPSLAWAFAVRINNLHAVPPTDSADYYMVYMCDAPISSAWNLSDPPELGKMGTCDGNMIVQVATSKTDEFIYTTAKRAFTLYVRASSVYIRATGDSWNTKVESDLGGDTLSATFAFPNPIEVIKTEPPSIYWGTNNVFKDAVFYDAFGQKVKGEPPSILLGR